ncbi:MAG: dihydrolipoyllysine-residue acetyltransferase [Proteobacteria bacterium]|nr:dihydrolipoyllysine-residue acetyltransferase [Pseudomonadota bacterium]
MATIKEISVPDIGNYTDVEIIEVAVKPGDKVRAEDSLITLETEKASMDVPSPYAGIIKEMKVKLGDKVSKDSLIALIEVAESETVPSKDNQAKEPPAPSKIAAPVKNEQPQEAKEELVTVSVPDTGAAKEVEVIEVAIKVGDVVKAEDTLITLESEKASMDIPSPYQGKIEKLLIKVGDKVVQGTPIVQMLAKLQPLKEATPAQRATVATSAPPEIPPRSQAPKQEAQKSVFIDFSNVHAGPATRRLARELGVDLTNVKGTGQRGRIVIKDVQTFVKSVMQNLQSGGGLGISFEKAPEVDFSQFGQIEVKPLSRIKKWTAKNLSRNWVTIPHVTQFDEADVTELEIFRQENQAAAKEHGTKLTPLPFIIMACVSALKTYPQFNASLAANGTDIVMKHYFHIGVAVDTPSGLMVPVIRNVDKKSLFDIAKELGELGALAKEGKLKAEQMQGSSFTISSLGSIGGTAFTPIINAPDVAILGISKVQIKPVFMNDQFVPRKILPLSLSYDHRVIDGVEGAKFAAFLAAQLQDIRKLLL